LGEQHRNRQQRYLGQFGHLGQQRKWRALSVDGLGDNDGSGQ